MLQETLQVGLLQKPALSNSIWYNGHTFSFLLDGEQTSGALVLIHCYFRKGGEPPAHFHQREDETFYILEGEIHFHIGEKKFTAREGELAFAPKGVPHSFSLVSETAKALLLITPPGIETFFKEFSMPAQSLELPSIPEGQPPALFMEKMLRRAEELGIVWMPEF
jgi:quercetin dioxygenase-like cupin family protein